MESTNTKKYSNKGRIHNLLLNRFLDVLYTEIKNIHPRSILDFGCGEGHFLEAMVARGLSKSTRVLGIDVKSEVIESAKRTLPEFNFKKVDILQSDISEKKFDLVLAIEVFEHIPKVNAYIQKLSSLSGKCMIISVPHEPWFRLANLFRGRDIVHLGNHPEHIHHWSPNSFNKFLSSYVQVTRLYKPFPWIVGICRPVVSAD